MNKVVIDFPPGACGHFLSRVLNSEYNFLSGTDGKFHNLEHAYKSITTSMERFAHEFESNGATTENVVCLHNFNNFDLGIKYPGYKLISIYVDSMVDVFLQNFYIKAIGSEKKTLDQYHASVDAKFGDSPCPLREEFYNLYQWIPNSSWAMTKDRHINLPFSYIYSYEKLNRFLLDSGFTVPDNFKDIHEDFINKQDKILNKSKLFKQVAIAVYHKENIDIPSELTEVDKGILAGILYEHTGIEVTDINSPTWFCTTAEILNYIK